MPSSSSRFFPEERLERLSLGPLSSGALHRLLEERLGLELTRPELARVQEATAGNPFFALELGRELVRTDTRPTPGRALRVPDSLRELLGGRLDRLPTHTGDVLLQAAALARPTVELVAAAHGDRERVSGGAGGGRSTKAVVQLDDSHVRFAHPLLASICLRAGAGLEAPCRAPHARGRGDGLRGAGPPSRRSPRRAPTLRIASELDTAAAQAAARGAPAAAAELCELAAELTPDDPALARQRRVRAATYHRLAGNGEIAAAILEQLLTEVPSGVERSDVLLELVRTFTADLPTMLELSDEALAEAAHDDARSSRILAIRAWSHFLRSDVPLGTHRCPHGSGEG